MPPYLCSFDVRLSIQGHVDVGVAVEVLHESLDAANATFGDTCANRLHRVSILCCIVPNHLQNQANDLENRNNETAKRDATETCRACAAKCTKRRMLRKHPKLFRTEVIPAAINTTSKSRERDVSDDLRRPNIGEDLEEDKTGDSAGGTTCVAALLLTGRAARSPFCVRGNGGEGKPPVETHVSGWQMLEAETYTLRPVCKNRLLKATT